MLLHFLIIGLLIGLGGWLLYWAGLPMIGAVIGASFGGGLGYVASALTTAPIGIPLFTGIGIVLGAVGGILLVKALQIYFFFATGVSLGAALGYKLVQKNIF